MTDEQPPITTIEAQAAIAADEQRRTENFIEEFKALQDKFECDLIPVITLSGNQVFSQFNVVVRK